ncbi:MAG: M23 family peptidase, partial [Nitrospirales bacterium]
MTRFTSPTFLVFAILLASIFPLNFFPHPQELPAGTYDQVSGKQGEVLVVTVPVQGDPDRVVGHLLNREIVFFPVGEGVYAGLLGLDMQDKPGHHKLMIQVEYPDRKER